MTRRDPEVDWTSEPEPIFTNGVRVACTMRGMALVFTEYQPFPGRGAAVGSFEPRERVVASLRTSPETYFEMISSLASAWNEFALESGKPDVLPRFRLFGKTGVQLSGTEDPERP